ncbi:MAG: RsmB/NOP family class I SAM-dependent RNA methyltransferase, partial [Lachnospiraceae bacterium]|nr:RsmB/NOP family class I SAM-dependent RNA methyltransferase [Lachnospiraceae bacterium]
MTDPAVPILSDPATALPEAFLARVKEQLHDEFPAFLASYQRPPLQALRVNTLKCGVQELQALIPRLTEPVPGTTAGLYFPEDLRPGLSPWHEAGLYYIQEPSAMLAVPALEAQPGEIVLDLCAAPGGKTTAIAADMKGEGLLIANEIVPKRAAVLSQNIERLGITNAVVTNHAPAELAGRFPEFFDRILVDAPCSGEGMFKKEPQAIEMWSPENVAACAARQDAILAEADKMLKPGGRLIYSTCTFAPEEDEGCVERFLAAHPGYDLLSMQTVYPHRFPGEGQFVAALQKEDAGTVLLSSFGEMGTAPFSPSRGRASSALKEAVSAWEAFADSAAHGGARGGAHGDGPFVSAQK